jgi:hypothetical protein
VNTPDTLVIVHSRHRPQLVEPLAQAWPHGGNAKLLLCVDNDDAAMSQYVDACQEHGVEILVGPRFAPWVVVNEIASRYCNSWEWLALCLDDQTSAAVTASGVEVAERGHLVTREQWTDLVDPEDVA